MFVATVIFSTNGIHAVIHAFVVSAHTFKTRSWVNQRKISVVLLLIIIFMISIAGFLVIFGKVAVNRLVVLHIAKRHFVIIFLIFLKWILVVLLLFWLFHSYTTLLLPEKPDLIFFTRINTCNIIVYSYFSRVLRLCK